MPAIERAPLLAGLALSAAVAGASALAGLAGSAPLWLFGLGTLLALLNAAWPRRAAPAPPVAASDAGQALDAIPSFVGYWDRALRNQFANRAAQAWFGRTPAEVLGEPLDRLLGTRQFELDRPLIDAVLRGEPQCFERQIPRPGGGMRQAELHYMPGPREGGEVAGFHVFLHDISAVADSRRRLADALRENEALLHTIKEQGLYSMADTAGTILDVNEGFCRISGYSRAELIGNNHRIVNSGQHPPEFWQQMWRTIAAGRAWRGEVCNRAKDGSLYWVHSIIAPFHGADGRIEKYISIRNDITAAKTAHESLGLERARLAAALRENEGLLYTIKEQGLYSMADTAGTILDVNEGFCRISGYARDELIGHNHRIVNSGTHPPEFWQQMWRTISSGRAWRGEVCNRAKDGSLYWVHSIIAPFVGADGRIEKYISIRNDITAAKTAHESLGLERARLDHIVRGMNAGTWEWNIANGALVCNERWAAMLGWRLHELQPLTVDVWQSFVHPDDIPRADRLMRRHFRGDDDQYEVELRVRHRDGRWLWVQDRGRVSQRNAAGRALLMHGTRQDISERHAAEDALREAMQQARAASAAKGNFLANMSHEIRTPLNAVIGLGYLLDNSPLNAEQREFVNQIQAAGRGLLGVVNDVLDLAKIEAGEVQLEARPFELAVLLGDLATVHGAQARAKGLAFELHAAPGLPAQLIGDAARLGQVLGNLLGNAVKFTEQGRIALGVQALAADADGLVLRFTVSDTGIGIDAEAQARVFEPFAQADVSTTRRFGGTGLGLSIVRQLAELMHGEVGCRSTPGEGSEFFLQLRLALATPRAVPGVARLRVQTTDPRIERLALGLGWQPQAEAEGADLALDGSAADAAALFQAADARLRAEGRHGAALDGSRLEGAGLAWLPGVRVLVVDDSLINREVAGRVLARQGAEVEGCESGLDALQRLGADAGFDAVLMDVQMPGLDGHETTRRLRALPGLADLPVIGLSANVLVVERQRALAAGMVDFLGKPLDPEALIRAVRHRAETRRGTALPVRERDEGPTETGADWPDIAGIDMADAMQRTGGDQRLFLSLLRRLLDEGDALAPALADCPAGAAARQALAARVHRLRGSAGMLGATAMHRAATDIETWLRASVGSATGHFPALTAPLLTALAELRGSSAAALMPPADAPPAAGAAPPDPEALALLARKLAQQDLSAMDAFEQLRPALTLAWGSARVQRLSDALDGLAFAAALALLDTPPP